jgi:hypothetical protein
VKFSLDAKGVAFEMAGERFVIPAPEHVLGGQTQKPVWQRGEDGKSGLVKYEGGFELQVAVDVAAGTITYDYSTSNVSPGVMLRFMTIIPIGYSQGGRYSLDGGPLGEFPVDLGDQLLVRGESTRVNIVSPGGAGFTIEAPVCWQAVQDNRKWNWNAFAWIYLYDLNKVPARRSFSFKISPRQA